MTLSPQAQIILTAIKQSNLWEQDTIKVLFPKPNYLESKHDYFQWDTNLYGNPQTYVLDGVEIKFEMNVDKSYSNQVYEFVKELKSAGLIKAVNAGYNEYYYQYTGK